MKPIHNPNHKLPDEGGGGGWLSYTSFERSLCPSWTPRVELCGVVHKDVCLVKRRLIIKNRVKVSLRPQKLRASKTSETVQSFNFVPTLLYPFSKLFGEGFGFLLPKNKTKQKWSIELLDDCEWSVQTYMPSINVVNQGHRRIYPV